MLKIQSKYLFPSLGVKQRISLKCWQQVESGSGWESMEPFGIVLTLLWLQVPVRLD